MWLKDKSCEEVVIKSWGNNQVSGSTRGFQKKNYFLSRKFEVVE